MAASAGKNEIGGNVDAIAAIGAAANRLQSVGLGEAGTVAVADRVDRKFIFPIRLLPGILDSAPPGYRVLEIDGRRLSRYRTVYYDSPDLTFYHLHQSGRLPRQKVRVRGYPDSGTNYLEVKWKTNKRRTVKARAALAWAKDESRLDRLLGEHELPATFVDNLPAGLTESLRMEYTRLTLVHEAGAERVTFDLRLNAARGDRTQSLEEIVIAEIKQECPHRSTMMQVLRERVIREVRISKYCISMALLEPELKRNGFRETLRRIARYSPIELGPTATSPPGAARDRRGRA
jgi:hypothetical protein